jgi:hypothetical protein
LFPALHSTNPELALTLKNQAGQPSGAKAAKRFRASLATVQIAMSMALLVPAGLFAKSLMNVSRVDLGLKPDHLVTFSLNPILNGYTAERSTALFEQLEERLAALPGVTSAVFSAIPVLAGDNWNNGVTVAGFEAGPDTDTSAAFNSIGPGFFKTMGMPLVQGRDFTRADGKGAPKVAIVNQAFVRKFSLGDRAIGSRMKGSRSEGAARRRDRRCRAGCEVQRREAADRRAVLHPVPPVRPDRLRQLLPPDRAGSRAADDRGAGGGQVARSQPADRRPEDNGNAGAGECVPRSDDQRAVHGVRRAGDAARRGRAVRRAGLYRLRSGRASSVCGWRSAPTEAASAGWCCARSA